MGKKGFIFDLDGVIVDTAKYHYQAWSKLAEGLGIPFTKEQNEELKGVSRVNSLQKILAWGDKTLTEEEFHAQLIKKNDDYLQLISNMDEREILNGVPLLLRTLTSQGQDIAVGSASRNAKRILRQVGILDMFTAVIDGNSVTKGKPDPEVFLLAAQSMALAPSECIVFEDAKAGVQAANAAGMISVGIGDQKNLSEADFIFHSVGDIPFAFIENLINK